MDFSDQVILVTGGTGSIGSEVVRQLLKLNAKLVRIFSNDENALFALQQELKEYKEFTRFLVGDVRDYERVKRAMRGVNLVIHAAALKHVPLGELNPAELVKTNILGTLNVMTAAAETPVDTLINISTDKAVLPTNVMGASKLMAERIIAAQGKHYETPKMYSVRFGNVLGSRGSFVETIRQCLQNNVPIPLTDPTMTRFIMTIRQAVRLVLETLDFAVGGETIILKMPKARIPDLIQAVAAIHATRPWTVEQIGLRPGERTQELLISPEELAYSWDCGDFIRIADKVSTTAEPDYDSATGPFLTVPEIQALLQEGVPK